MKNSLVFLFLIVTVGFLCCFSKATFGQNLSAEEIVAKHLDSIGPAEKRRNLKNRVATGLVQYTVLRQGGRGGNGKIVVASEGIKSLFGMTFSIPSYPAETIIFDGNKSKIAYAINNVRSQFGDFLYRYDNIVSENLLGGSLLTGWALTDLGSRKARVEYDGVKKISDKEVHVLSYRRKGGSDVEIKIYIDKNTFEHVRTEYRRVIAARQGLTIDSSSQQREQRQVLMEDFSNFKKEKDFNLPHTYRAYVKIDGSSGTLEYEWKAEFTEFFFDQPLDPNSFAINSD